MNDPQELVHLPQLIQNPLDNPEACQDNNNFSKEPKSDLTGSSSFLTSDEALKAPNNRLQRDNISDSEEQKTDRLKGAQNLDREPNTLVSEPSMGLQDETVAHLFEEMTFSNIDPLQDELLGPAGGEREQVIDGEDQDMSESDEEVEQLIKNMGHIKANFYLRHSMAFFVAFLLLARYSLEILDNGSGIKEIFFILYAYLSYSFLEEINFYLKYKTSDNDTKITYIYAGLDVFSLICSLTILHLKFLKILPSGKAASLPGFVICTLFYFSPYRRKGAKILFLAKRIIETIQIYLIEAKTDGGLEDLPWKSLLAYMWIYIFVRILVLIASLKAVKPLLPPNCRRAKFLLSLWHYFYIILFLIALLAYIGYSHAFDSKGSVDLLKKCLLGGQICSAFLLLFTVWTKPFLLVAFTRVSSMDYQASEFGEMILDPSSIGMIKKTKVENKSVYFSMVSATYFRELKKGIFATNQMELDEIKQNMLSILIRRLKEILHNNYDSLSQSLKRSIFQRIMDLHNLFIQPENEEQISDLGREGSSAESDQALSSPRETKSEPSLDKHELTTLLDSLNAQAKRLCSSATFNRKKKASSPGIGNKGKTDVCMSPSRKAESLCYVCFHQLADGIVMECGHGGFCYECAMKYLMLKNQCMACRGPAERIAKIRMKPVFGSIYKGNIIGKVVNAVDSGRCQWIVE